MAFGRSAAAGRKSRWNRELREPECCPFEKFCLRLEFKYEHETYSFVGWTKGLLSSKKSPQYDLLSLDTNQVKLSSVLFGSRNFPADRLLAVTLGEPTEAPARYRVRTEDGSVIRAKSLTAGYDCIIAEELRLGKLTLGLDQLLQIERTAGTKAMSNE